MRQRFVRLPIDVLNDQRLSDGAIRVYAVMLDASRANQTTISLHRIGERLGRKRDAARRCVRELVQAGHVAELPKRNGQCPKYQLLTRSENATGTGSEIPTGTHSEIPTGATNLALPRSENATPPLRKHNGTRSENATQSIRNSLNLGSLDDVARAHEEKPPKDDPPVDVASKLRALGLTDAQAAEATRDHPDLAAQWADSGFDGVPADGIRNPTGFVIHAIRNGLAPKPRGHLARGTDEWRRTVMHQDRCAACSS
ncbi:MAG TPA: helix-turn-helix domain-containing protein, partial [Candidatus Tumulicola sp.]|nr:helix-turn-helix domain-containing protein [Candidatus Tumulicola sp.]